MSKYRFGYQGQYAEKDEETGWNHFLFREFDAIIGRWLVPDPMREFWSPYVAMGNNPIGNVDPTGGETDPPVGTIDGGRIFTEHGWLQIGAGATVTGREWSEVDTMALNKFALALDAFGAFLEQMIDIPEGSGIAFYSEIGGGTPYHTRNGQVTHGILDPAAMLKAHQGAGNIFKNMTPSEAKKVVTILELLNGTKDNMDAYDKFQGKDLTEMVVDLTGKAVHGIQKMAEDSTDGAPVIMGLKNNKQMTKTQRYKGGYIKVDTLDMNVLDYPTGGN